MLPYLKKAKQAAVQTGIIMKTRQPDEPNTSEDIKDDPNAAIEACASDLIKAIHMKNTAAVAEALRAAFEIMDSEPHTEGPHIAPHSYDAQKD